MSNRRGLLGWIADFFRSFRKANTNKYSINNENVHLNQMGYDDNQIEAMELEEDFLHEEHDYF